MYTIKYGNTFVAKAAPHQPIREYGFFFNFLTADSRIECCKKTIQTYRIIKGMKTFPLVSR